MSDGLESLLGGGEEEEEQSPVGSGPYKLTTEGIFGQPATGAPTAPFGAPIDVQEPGGGSGLSGLMRPSAPSQLQFRQDSMFGLIGPYLPPDIWESERVPTQDEVATAIGAFVLGEYEEEVPDPFGMFSLALSEDVWGRVQKLMATPEIAGWLGEYAHASSYAGVIESLFEMMPHEEYIPKASDPNTEAMDYAFVSQFWQETEGQWSADEKRLFAWFFAQTPGRVYIGPQGGPQATLDSTKDIFGEANPNAYITAPVVEGIFDVGEIVANKEDPLSETIALVPEETKSNFLEGVLSPITGTIDAVIGSNLDSSDDPVYQRGGGLPRLEGAEREEVIHGQNVKQNPRNTLAARMIEWLRTPGRTLESEDDRKDFLLYAYQNVQQLQQEHKSRTTVFGGLGEVAATPYRWTSAELSAMWSYAKSPTENMHRRALSPGENSAIMMGLNPGDEAGSSFLNQPVVNAVVRSAATTVGSVIQPWEFIGDVITNIDDPTQIPGAIASGNLGTEFVDNLAKYGNSFQFVSGATDLMLNLSPLDPIQFGANFALGLKAARTIPRPLDMTAAAAQLRAVLPFYGARFNLPRFQRGMTARFAWSVASRSMDEMIASGPAQRAFANIAKMRSVSEITAAYPMLKGRSESIGILLSEANTQQQVEDIVRYAWNGGFLHQNPGAIGIISQRYDDAVINYERGRDAALADGRIGIGESNVVFDKVDYAKDGVWKLEDEVERVFPSNVMDDVPLDEGVTASIERNLSGRLANAAEHVRATLKNGVEVVIRKAGNNYAAYDEATGEFLGGLSASRGEIAVMEDARGQGLGRILVDNADPEEVQKLRESTSVSRSAADLLGMGEDVVTPGKAAPGTVYVASEINLDGSRKMVLSGLHGGVNTANLGNDAARNKLVAFLGKKGPAGQALAAKIQQSSWGNMAGNLFDFRFSNLDADELKLIGDWAETVGADIVRTSDESILSSSGAKKAFSGMDVEGTKGVDTVNSFTDKYLQVVNADRMKSSVRAANPRMWYIIDMPVGGYTNKAVNAAVKPWRNQGRSNRFSNPTIRRVQQYIFGSRPPKALSLVNGDEGAEGLRNWLLAIGMKTPKANAWADEFLKAGPNMRFDIVFKAFADAGNELNHPLLKEALISFFHKQGFQEYGFNRAGESLGVTRKPGGSTSNVPVLPTQFAATVPMPDVHEVISGLRRYRHAKSKWFPTFTGGVLTRTNKKRRALAATYKQQITNRSGVKAAAAYTDDEYLAMAYGTVVEPTAGSANGIGVAHKLLVNAPRRFWQGFAGLFAVAQLAGRPMAWAFRVLMEEQVRSDLMGLPSAVKQPWRWLDDSYTAHMGRMAPKWRGAIEDDANQLIATVRGSGAQIEARMNEISPSLVAEYKELKNVTDFKDLSADDVRALRNWMRKKLIDEVSAGSKLGGKVVGARGSWAHRGLMKYRYSRQKTASARFQKAGMSRMFDWEQDAAGIAGRSLASEFVKESEAAVHRYDWLPNMTGAQAQQYGRALARRIYTDLEDPFVVKFGLPRAALQGDIPDELAGAALARHPQWQVMREGVAEMADTAGLRFGNDQDLADWYLVNVLDEYIDANFSWMWRDNMGNVNEGAKVRIAGGLASRQEVAFQIGDADFTFQKKKNSYKQFIETFGQAAEAGRQFGHDMPRTLAVHFDPRYGVPGDESFLDGARKVADWTLRTFGESATQKLNRQPAYVAAHRQWFKHFKRIGLDDDAARIMADEKAAESVNYIFYNTKAQTRFLRDMNNVIPFFTAWWEVAQTWAYKIPMQNVTGVGHVHLLRKVDRFMKGLVKAGLVEQGEPDEFGNRQWFLNLKQTDGGELNAFGAALSQAGHSMMRSPVEIIEWMGNFGKMMIDPLKIEDGNVSWSFDRYEPLDLSEWGKDGFKLAIGSPVNPLDHGLFAVNQLFAGTNPLITQAYSYMKGNFFQASDEEVVNVPAGTKLADLIAQTPSNVDWQDIVEYNGEALEEAFGTDTYEDLLDGTVQLDTVIAQIPEDMQLVIPRSSMWENLAEEFINPFGEEPNFGRGILNSISPSALQYVYRGLGILDGDLGGLDGFLQTLTDSPQSQMQITGEVLSSIAYLESTEGVITKRQKIANELFEIQNTTDPEALDPDSDDAKRFRQLMTELEDWDAEIVRRANNMAGGNLILRGLLGWTTPGTPQMYWDEQAITSEFWGSRRFAEQLQETGRADLTDSFDGVRVTKFEDLERIAELTNAWLTDETGTLAKAWVLDNYPSLLAFTQGRTYWGPAGPPKEFDTIDDYFEAVRNGDRLPYDPEVFIQKIGRLGIVADFESDIIRNTGTNDPIAQAQFLLSPEGYAWYSDRKEELGAQYDAMDWTDREVLSNVYGDYVNRNSTDELTLLEAARDEHRKVQDAVDYILNELDIDKSFSEDERRRFAGQLNSLTRGVGDLIESYREKFDEDPFDQPRDQIIIAYFDYLNETLYKPKAALYDELVTADGREARSMIFEEIRDLENDHYNKAHTFQWGEESFQLTDSFTRSWALKTDEEKMNSYLRWLSGLPEWMNQFEMERLLENSPTLEQFIPSTEADFEIYREATELKRQVYEQGSTLDERGEPLWSEYEMRKFTGQIDDGLEQWLIDNGRSGEVLYMRAWPIERLVLAQMLPQNLNEVQRYVTGIHQELDAMDDGEGKGPTSEAGRAMFLQLKNYLESDLYIRRPDIMDSMRRLGEIMYDETDLTRVYPKLWYGAFGFTESLE